jgi:hypothetical protein
MRVRLQKTRRDRHLIEVRRDDGSTLRMADLETRSTLRHDLMHWSFEHAARLRDSFFGQIAGGGDPTQINMAMQPGDAPTELHGTEVLVGMLQGAAADEVDPVALVAMAGEMLTLLGHRMPPFLTPDFVRGVLAHYRQLVGQWDFLRVGGVLELEFTW